MANPSKPSPAPDPQGRSASSPFAMPAQGWKEVLVRTWKEAGNDNASLVAAGVSFYGFLALVPLLGAVVLTYGLVAQPATVLRNMQNLTSVMPADAAKLIGEQLMNVVQTSGGKKGFGLILALAIALFGARNGAASIITALNIAYEETETRSFIRLNLLALAITAAAVLVALLAMAAIAALGHLEKLFPGAPGFVLVIGKIAVYALVGVGGAAGAATLYRFAPNREEARWTWLTPGSAGAAILWLLLTVGFGFYVARFGNYGATYGSLGAVVVLLTWLYLSAYILLLGAELNSELEHQTARDTTTGPERALGTRGAESADTVAGEERSPEKKNEVTTGGAGGGSKPPSTGTTAPGFAKDYVTSRIAQRGGRIVGLAKVPAAPALLTASGLSLLRRRDKAPVGFGLLLVGGFLAWRSGSNAKAAASPAERRKGDARA